MHRIDSGVAYQSAVGTDAVGYAGLGSDLIHVADIDMTGETYLKAFIPG